MKTHEGLNRETYVNPELQPDVRVTDVPIVRATEASLNEVGCLVRILTIAATIPSKKRPRISCLRFFVEFSDPVGA